MFDPPETIPATPEHAAAFDALLWDLFMRLMDVPGDRVEAEIFGRVDGQALLETEQERIEERLVMEQVSGVRRPRG